MKITHEIFGKYCIVTNNAGGFCVYTDIPERISDKTGKLLPPVSSFSSYHSFFSQALNEIISLNRSKKKDIVTVKEFIKDYEKSVDRLLTHKFEFIEEKKSFNGQSKKTIQETNLEIGIDDLDFDENENLDLDDI